MSTSSEMMTFQITFILSSPIVTFSIGFQSLFKHEDRTIQRNFIHQLSSTVSSFLIIKITLCLPTLIMRTTYFVGETNHSAFLFSIFVFCLTLFTLLFPSAPLRKVSCYISLWFIVTSFHKRLCYSYLL